MELTLRLGLGIRNKPMDDKNKIAAKLHLTKGGPMKIVGRFYIVDTQGNNLAPGGAGDVYLCACGNSQKKPFCDGSHKKHD